MQCLEYTVPHGKKNRGLTVPATFGLLKPDHTQDEMESALVLGWCVEIVRIVVKLRLRV